MAEPTLTFEASDLAEQLTMQVSVKGYQGWRFRLRIAVWLIRLAAWIARVNLEVIDE